LLTSVGCWYFFFFMWVVGKLTTAWKAATAPFSADRLTNQPKVPATFPERSLQFRVLKGAKRHSSNPTRVKGKDHCACCPEPTSRGRPSVGPPLKLFEINSKFTFSTPLNPPPIRTLYGSTGFPCAGSAFCASEWRLRASSNNASRFLAISSMCA